VIRRVEGRLRAAGTAGSGDDGFTIVEAVVSMVLLIVLSTAVLAAVLSSIRLAEQVRSRTVATELATREVAQTRALLDAGSISVDDLIAGTATSRWAPPPSRWRGRSRWPAAPRASRCAPAGRPRSPGRTT
jgi:type II secretory pathway pseudopilin PulG